ncbi:MAG: hypothetical protein QF726_09180, partial [Alphaproteobacteria bacterium]|nr:hypothetical protein [Alphaproteobacteria bacterium]
MNPKYSDALEAMRTYRKAMTAFLAKAPKRSAIYREAEVAIRQADELALLMTGDVSSTGAASILIRYCFFCPNRDLVRLIYLLHPSVLGYWLRR